MVRAPSLMHREKAQRLIDTNNKAYVDKDFPNATCSTTKPPEVARK